MNEQFVLIGVSGRKASHRRVNFKQFLGSTKWCGFDEYVEIGQRDLRAEIQRNVRSEHEIRMRLRDRLLTKYATKLRKVTPGELAAASNTLRADVAGVDGTRAQVQLLSGIRTQLGVVTVNYENDRTSYVSYVTELTYNDFKLERDIEDIVNSRTRDDRTVSEMAIRGALAYSERERALESRSRWKIVHGELFPFELRSGLGKLEALDMAMTLFEKLEKARTICAVVSDTSSVDINYGFALERDEYFRIADLKFEYDDWLKNNAKFNPKDRLKFADFNNRVAVHIVKGIYKVGQRPFVFYAHEDVFDEAAAILIADSHMVPERGFPHLIDYADSICASLFRAGDFERRVLHELALEGEMHSEVSERASRSH